MKRAEVAPHQIAASNSKERITYGELSTQMGNVKHQMDSLGVKSGNLVLFLTPLTPKVLPIVLGILQAGIGLIIADPFTAPELFANRVKRAGATHAIVNYKLSLISKVLPILPQSLLKFDFMKELKSLGDIEIFSYGSPFHREDASRWVNNKAAEMGSVSGNLHDTALIIFTSGTTSEPKGVRHTFKSLVVNTPSVRDSLGITQGTVVYSEPTSIGLVCLMSGAEWVMPERGESVRSDTEVWFSTPHDLREQMDSPHFQNLPRLKTVGLASAPVTASTPEYIDAHLNHKVDVICFYGMTEFLPIAIGDVRKKKDFLSAGADGDYVGELVGDTQAWEHENELIVSGSGLMPGYLHKEGLSALHTGDFGRIEGSSVFLLGRKKDMYIRRSMNIYPGLYEPLLETITGVNKAAIVGRRNLETGDDYIMLAVQPNSQSSNADIKSAVEEGMVHCMDLESVPDAVVIVEAFPVKGRANKLDRDALAEIAWQELQK